jgi:peptidoglycan hydrolase-like protein with peptidoglycan-binding domain
VQSALNQIMNLQLPVTGFMNAPTRSALRSFQEKQGLPIDGIAGPETKEALLAAKGGKSPGADATKPAETGMTEPASTKPAAEFDFEFEVALDEFQPEHFAWPGEVEFENTRTTKRKSSGTDCGRSGAPAALASQPGGRCIGPTPPVCPSVTGILSAQSISTIPFEYIANVARDKSTNLMVVTQRYRPRTQRFLPSVQTALIQFVNNMNRFGMPIEAILTAGSYCCRCVSKKNYLSNHSYGDAFDLVGVRWASGRGETIVHNWRSTAERILLRRINACLRLSFATVIDYHREDHRDHFHGDMNRGNPRDPRRSETLRFTQEALSIVLCRTVTVTGKFDAATQRALIEFGRTSADALKSSGQLNQILDQLFTRIAASPTGSAPSLSPSSSSRVSSVPPATVPSAGTPNADTVRFAQRVLNATERERLDDDGKLGRLTRGALARFRTRYGLGLGGVLDAKTELALAQSALEEIAQQSIFAQPGMLDAKTEQALITFKSDRGLGFNATLDAATRAALTDALSRRASAPSGSVPVGALDRIIQVAAESKIARYRWRDRGVSPLGYIKGMALVYARVYCKLKAGDAAATEMAKANTGNTDKDALAHYAQEFNAVGMNNESAGVDTLRHLFVLLIGLGMRESSGSYCRGRDRSAPNTAADTAEAGLFQTSFNARGASPLLPQLFQQYLANPSGFLEIFKEGARCRDSDRTNFGSGPGKEFQRLSKECPAFAAEFTAVALRNRRKHWGPIKRKTVEIRPECDAMLLQVQKVVDEFKLCPVR